MTDGLPLSAGHQLNDSRTTIFLSHASPADNEFAIWLSARLVALGYNVWCDQQKLLGGEDFWKDIEATLRTKTAKFVLVISKNIRNEDASVRDGIAKEVAVAEAMKKKHGDPYFIVPALIDDTPYDEFGIEFIRLNGINFKTNWAAGLVKLIEVLERDKVARNVNLVAPAMQAWRDVHQALARSISDTPEVLQSNWLEVIGLPEWIHFYDLQLPYSFAEIQALASECPLPCTDHGRLLVAFAELDEMAATLGETRAIVHRGRLPSADFLAGRTGDILGITPADARRKLSSLIRQAWEVTARARGLTSYEMANGHLAWWFPEGVPSDGQLHYVDLNGKPRRRAVRGIRGKKETEDGREVPRYYWHLGFTVSPYIGDETHLVLKPRIIISDDGQTPLKSKKKLNSVRRALTKMWFNDKWRGLVSGFSAWLAEGGETITLSAATAITITATAAPMEFAIPKGIAADPAIVSEEDEEMFELEQTALRASDPAFAYPGDDDDEEDEGGEDDVPRPEGGAANA